jgi:hypothetical protein
VAVQSRTWRSSSPPAPARARATEADDHADRDGDQSELNQPVARPADAAGDPFGLAAFVLRILDRAQELEQPEAQESERDDGEQQRADRLHEQRVQHALCAGRTRPQADRRHRGERADDAVDQPLDRETEAREVLDKSTRRRVCFDHLAHPQPILLRRHSSLLRAKRQGLPDEGENPSFSIRPGGLRGASCPLWCAATVPAENVPEIVRSLIARHIDSVLELEILLLLYGSRPRAWSADEVVEKLRIDRAWAVTQLGRLCDHGLLRCEASPAPTYAYAPASADTDAAAAALDAAYADRRVSVIELIFAKPLDKIRSFADAFRIRGRDKDNKEKDDGG